MIKSVIEFPQSYFLWVTLATESLNTTAFYFKYSKTAFSPYDLEDTNTLH